MLLDDKVLVEETEKVDTNPIFGEGFDVEEAVQSVEDGEADVVNCVTEKGEEGFCQDWERRSIWWM